MSAIDPLQTLNTKVQDCLIQRQRMAYLSELRGYHKALGPVRFWAMLIGTVLVVLLLAGADVWLSDKIGWPEAYGFQCRGRDCWIQNWMHSPKLLRGGSAYELSLFALLWWMPTVVVGCAIYGLRRRLGRHRTRPMD